VALYLLDVDATDPATGNGKSKMFLSMLGAFAEFERDRIGERIRATKQAQKARGEYLGGVAPFGWIYDDARKLVPVPEQ
jgi:DNA invertase Pin-like site-specific DNA recombinase